MPALNRAPLLPEGISFEINDLMMLRNWAERNALHLGLELDHQEGSREYEEYASLTPEGGRHRLATMWRTRDAVMIMPFAGATRRFASIAHALAALQVRNGLIEMRRSHTSEL